MLAFSQGSLPSPDHPERGVYGMACGSGVSCKPYMRFGESSNLVSESKIFVKDEAKVSSRVGGVE